MDDPADNILEEAPAPIGGIATRRHPELESGTDDGLVTLMAFKDTDEGVAMKACEELHRRHARFILGWCIKNRCETLGAAAEEFVNQAFLKAYNEASRFVCTDKDEATSQVKAWLFRIMKNRKRYVGCRVGPVQPRRPAAVRGV
jgi:hypothetical protein